MTRAPAAAAVACVLLGAVLARADEPAKVRPTNVPPHLFESQRIAGEMPHLPDAVKAQHKEPTLVWMGMPTDRLPRYHSSRRTLDRRGRP